MTFVYLAWLNDMLLDVYQTRNDAIARLTDYRKQNPGNWKQLDGGRWYQHPGGVARLEVEDRKVK